MIKKTYSFGDKDRILKQFPDLDADFIDSSYLNTGLSKFKLLSEKPKPFDWESDPDYTTDIQPSINEDSEVDAKLKRITNLLSSELLLGDFDTLDQRTLLNYVQEAPNQEPPTQQN